LRKIIKASKANVIVDGNAFSGVKEKNYAKEVYKDIMNWTRPDSNGDDWRWEKTLDFVDGYSKSYGSNWDADDVFLNDESSFVEWLISLGGGISLMRNFENELENYLESPNSEVSYPNVLKFTRQTSKSKVYSTLDQDTIDYNLAFASSRSKATLEDAYYAIIEVFGSKPNEGTLLDIYHEYEQRWRKYESFEDFLINDEG
jgi:hypothetical protein